MKNILIGNGINIQYNGYSSTNNAIVYRALNILSSPDFPIHIFGENAINIKLHFGNLFAQINLILLGEYDDYCTCNAERIALSDFKIRYKDRLSLKVTDIGFEDYYLIHDLICHKVKVGNPDQYQTREMIKGLFLDSIFNAGEVNNIAKNFSENFVEWLKQFDLLFTLNYDENVEQAIQQKVYHLHGEFNTRKEIYIPGSPRNQLSDNPVKDYVIDENYSHIYSTALSTHCGNYKESYLKQNSIFNNALEKLAQSYLVNFKSKEDIDSWIGDENKLVANLGESILLKVKNPEYKYRIDYPIKEFASIEGELHILGVSPFNDKHLFEMINQSNLGKCVFYYYDKSEISIIKDSIQSCSIEFIDVKEFWREYCGEKPEKIEGKTEKHKFVDVNKANFAKTADCFRALSLSKLPDEKIASQYNQLNKTQREEIVIKLREIETHTEYTIDEQFVLRIIDIHLIAEHYNIDPAVVMCVGTINKRGNYVRLI